MTKAALTPYPGVLTRPDSRIYQFGLRVPRDLLSQFASPWAVRCSLATADLRTANDKARALQAEWAERFRALRSGQSHRVDMAAIRIKLLEQLERFAAGLDAHLARVPAGDRAERAETMQWQINFVREEQAGHRVADIIEDELTATIQKLGYQRSPATDDELVAWLLDRWSMWHEALTDSTRTYPLRIELLKARRELVGLQGAQRQEPQAAGPHRGVTHTIADALTEWADADTRPAKTVAAFTRHAAQFAELMGNPCLESIDKVGAIRFRDALQRWATVEGKTARTADNALVSIRALVNVARDKGWLDANPFERLVVAQGGRPSAGREPWTHSELATLFDDPIWTAYRMPADRKAGGEAAYWIPLIACFTGARVSEIAQLWTDDLSGMAGARAIEFKDNPGRKQKLKTASSRRAVPMHSELVRLGLPTYAESLPLGPLFPKLPTDGKNGAGGQFSQWFGRFKQGKGFETSSKTFHSFRHLVASELRLQGATDALADAITGHQGTGLGRNVYAATMGRQAERLRPTIELLRFNGLAHLVPYSTVG